jgi:transcription termination/antitermination protein NusA
MDKEIEAIIAREAGYGVEDGGGFSTDALIDQESADSASDAYSGSDAREEMIEFENDAIDTLVNDSQDATTEGVDNDGWNRDRE